MFDPECLECDERCVGGTPDVGDVARAWLLGICATGGGGVAGTSPGGSPDIPPPPPPLPPPWFIPPMFMFIPDMPPMFMFMFIPPAFGFGDDCCDIPTLGSCDDPLVGGEVGVAHPRADPQPAVGQVGDLGRGQAGDVDERARGGDAEPQVVDEVGAAGEVAGVGPLREQGERLLHVGRPRVVERPHEDTDSMASTMPL